MTWIWRGIRIPGHTADCTSPQSLVATQPVRNDGTHSLCQTYNINSQREQSFRILFFFPSSIALWTLAIMPIASIAVPDYWWDLDGNYAFSEGEKTARLFLIGLKLKRHPSDGGSHPFSILVLSLSTAERFIAGSPEQKQSCGSREAKAFKRGFWLKDVDGCNSSVCIQPLKSAL